MGTVTGEVAVRPRGALYRAQKKPVAHAYGGDDVFSSCGIVVTRTHDVDVAVALAGEAWHYYFNDGRPLPSPTPGWTRVVPWDTGGGSDWSWDFCVGVERGSIPCVWFDENNYGPEVDR